MREKICENELFLLIELAMTGRADESQMRRLGTLLEHDPVARELYARAWMLDVDLQRVYQSGGATPFGIDSCEPPPDSDRKVALAPRRTWARYGRLANSLSWVAAAVVVAVLCGYLLGVVATRSGLYGQQPAVAGGATPLPQAGSNLRVQLTKASQCVWGDSVGLTGGLSPRGVHGGETLELLEGFATFAVNADDWQAKVQIEGPAAIVVTSQGLPALRQGQMLVNLTSAVEPLSVGLPFAEVHLLPGSEVGVMAFGGWCEVHVFRGAASIEGLWSLPSGKRSHRDRTCVVAEGSSVALESHGGNLRIAAESTANRGMFDVKEFLKGGQLVVTEKYVNKVLSAKPIAYWRFEEIVDGVVLNAVQDRFHMKVEGDLQLHGLIGNRHANFSLDDTANYPRFLRTREPITSELPGDYTIEWWMNPSHFHTSTLLAFLVPEKDKESLPASKGHNWSTDHGLLLEIGGSSGQQSIMQPRRLRYVHRNPVGYTGGSATYGKSNYRIREWQHVVCQKEGDTMRAYINGEQCSEATDATKLAPELIAVVGQLSDFRFERSFYGQIDEMAIYDRALSEEEIASHYRSVQFIDRSKAPHSHPSGRPELEL